ncbi:recombinase family protein [Streptomyces sp. PpalLS-921]|uniref:recombinase family protein n=1 Tax=Streptomyces sp. PpalLS-921 TaxID=1839772 RepID=UPI000B832533
MQDPHVAAAVAARLRSGRRALRAVDYVRVSTEEQAKGYGIAYSGKRTARHIRQKGWEHVGTFVDEGVSGALESRQRPALRRLMEQAWMGPRPFDIVVMNEGRAIGRTGRAFWRWVWELQEIGIFVAVVKRDYDNSTPEGRARCGRMPITPRTSGRSFASGPKAESRRRPRTAATPGARSLTATASGRAASSWMSVVRVGTARRNTRRAPCGGGGGCTSPCETGARRRSR